MLHDGEPSAWAKCFGAKCWGHDDPDVVKEEVVTGWHGPAVPVMYTRFTNPEVIAAAIKENQAAADAAKKNVRDARLLSSQLLSLRGKQPPPRTRVKYAYDSNGWRIPLRSDDVETRGVQAMLQDALEWFTSLGRHSESGASSEKHMQIEATPSSAVEAAALASKRSNVQNSLHSQRNSHHASEREQLPPGPDIGYTNASSPKAYLSSVPNEALERKVKYAEDAFDVAVKERANAIKVERRATDILEEFTIKSRASSSPRVLPKHDHEPLFGSLVSLFSMSKESGKQIGAVEGEDAEGPWWERMYARAEMIREKRLPADDVTDMGAPSSPTLRSSSRKPYRGYMAQLSERGVFERSLGTQRKSARDSATSQRSSPSFGTVKSSQSSESTSNREPLSTFLSYLSYDSPGAKGSRGTVPHASYSSDRKTPSKRLKRDMSTQVTEGEILVSMRSIQ